MNYYQRNIFRATNTGWSHFTACSWWKISSYPPHR